MDARSSREVDWASLSEGAAAETIWGWRGDGNCLAVGKDGEVSESSLWGADAVSAIACSLHQERKTSLGRASD